MTRVKICGITRLEDAAVATELGAWALGMIFWPGSVRACDLEEAERIAAGLRRRVELCGVFVNASLEHVAEVAARAELALIQLHGDEGPAYAREVARRTGARVMKAARVDSAADVRALRPFSVDFHLLDTYRPGHRGGTGETFSWDLVAAHDRRVPLVLSGGLTPDNVAAGIREARPFAVDTASGTEAGPGRKDRAKLTAFFRAVAQADADLARDAAPAPAPAPALAAVAERTPA